MSQVAQAYLPKASPCLPAMRIQPVGIDDWADVRYIHALSFDRIVAPWLEAEPAAAFREQVATPDYVDALMMENLYAAWLDGQMTGTCGWRPADDAGAVARVTSLFVHPIFSRMGFGRGLLHNAENRASDAGFRVLTLRSTVPAVQFFEALGYDVTSYGVAALGGGHDMPVIFMRKSI